MRGILAGAFALVVLQVLVANPRATDAVGGVATGLAGAVHWFLDPNTPAIPDRSKPKAATTDAAKSSAGLPLGQPPYGGSSVVV